MAVGNRSFAFLIPARAGASPALRPAVVGRGEEMPFNQVIRPQKRPWPPQIPNMCERVLGDSSLLPTLPHR